MSESLLSPSRIKLFGRPFNGLTLNAPSADDVSSAEEPAAGTHEKSASDEPQPQEPSCCVPDASQDLLANQLLREGATLARIYGFSYEGQYSELPVPAVYLVHGAGRMVNEGLAGELDRSGVAARDWAFEKDVRYWEYDRVSYAIRLDIVSGTLDEILIEASDDEQVGGGSRSRMSARSKLSSRSKLSARSDFGSQHRMK